MPAEMGQPDIKAGDWVKWGSSGWYLGEVEELETIKDAPHFRVMGDIAFKPCSWVKEIRRG